jgi:hypothetical protein
MSDEPIDLPLPVCDIHDNPEYPCPECEHAEKWTTRVVIAVPVMLIIATSTYLWLAH